MAPSHHYGRKARRYPGKVADLHHLIDYDPETGKIATVGPYASRGRVTTDGNLHLRVPFAVGAMDRGRRQAVGYFRADHIAWAMLTGWWPTGFIEHPNQLRLLCSRTNLVHVEGGTRLRVDKTEEGLYVVVDDLPQEVTGEADT
jgi:hypothetical protein